MNKTVPAVSDEKWRYSINYGPDGEEDWANLITPEGDHVANIRTHHAIRIVNTLNAAALAAQGQAPVAVVKLEWREDGKYLNARAGDREYCLNITSDGETWAGCTRVYAPERNLTWGSVPNCSFLPLEAAKAACDADYAARILSQVITAPAQPVGVPSGPVAIWKHLPGGNNYLDVQKAWRRYDFPAAFPLYAAPQPPAEGGWRPMDSAPKDGTEILVYGRKEGGGYYRDVQSWPGDWVGSWPVEYMGYAAGGPLGWMPLPPAPANGGDTHG